MGLSILQKVTPVKMKVSSLPPLPLPLPALPPPARSATPRLADSWQGRPLPSQLRSRPGSSSPKFAPRLLMPLLVRRVSPPGGLTWPTASTPPSSELVTLASVSALQEEQWPPRRVDLRRLHRRHDQGRRVHEGARHHRPGCRSPHW